MATQVIKSPVRYDLTINGVAVSFTGEAERKLLAQITHPSTIDSPSLDADVFALMPLQPLAVTVAGWEYRLVVRPASGANYPGIQHSPPNRLSLGIDYNNGFAAGDHRRIAGFLQGPLLQAPQFDWSDSPATGGTVTGNTAGVYTVNNIVGPFCQPNLTLVNGYTVNAQHPWATGRTVTVVLSQFGFPAQDQLRFSTDYV